MKRRFAAALYCGRRIGEREPSIIDERLTAPFWET